MSNPKLQLEVITQERQVFADAVDKVSAPAVEGEVTILPGHIPLFTRLEDGILKITQGKTYREFALVGGFMDVGPDNKVTVMADHAIGPDETSVAQAEAAKAKAEAAMKTQESEFALKQAEIALRKAVMELKIARRRRVPPSNLPTES